MKWFKLRHPPGGARCAARARHVCWPRRGERKWNLAKARRSHDNDVYVPHRIFNNDANFALTFVMTGLLTISKILLTFKALFIKENCQISASFMRISAAPHIVLNTIRQLNARASRQTANYWMNYTGCTNCMWQFSRISRYHLSFT